MNIFEKSREDARNLQQIELKQKRETKGPEKEEAGEQAPYLKKKRRKEKKGVNHLCCKPQTEANRAKGETWNRWNTISKSRANNFGLTRPNEHRKVVATAPKKKSRAEGQMTDEEQEAEKELTNKIVFGNLWERTEPLFGSTHCTLLMDERLEGRKYLENKMRKSRY
jgi:hypothetical protein